jgi:hypothetical protein
MQVVEIKIGAEGLYLMPPAGGSVEVVVSAVKEDKKFMKTYINKDWSRLQPKELKLRFELPSGRWSLRQFWRPGRKM